MSNKTPREPKEKTNLYWLIILAVNTLIFFVFYRVLIYFGELTQETFYSFLTMVAYMALLLIFGIAYLIYNRFFYRKGLAPEDLNPQWTEEQKEAFLADGERRIKKSKWMLTVILPLLFVFLFDSILLIFF